MNLAEWEKIFEAKISEIATTDDPAHDLLHFKRVVQTAKKLCAVEKGKIEVVVPAAWLHDFVIIPKNSPLRSQASRLAARGAIGLARCFATAGLLKSKFYSENDPFCEARTLDDSRFTIDHFYKKLFKTAETLKTHSGKQEGRARVEVMKKYLLDLSSEVLP